MGRRIVETALREAVPVKIAAGGSLIKVTHARDTVLRSTYIAVVDEEDIPHVILHITMASLHYLL